MPSGYRIECLTLTDFKSYRGTHSIGPFPSGFVSIIGSNGSGKSNIMDAISFVLGADARRLRGENLRRLITVDATSAAVDLTFTAETSADHKITRRITTSGVSQYLINSAPVSAATYRDFLHHDLGLGDPAAQLCPYLVFQGDAETLASQTGPGLARLVDSVSGSATLAESYNGLASSKDAAEDRLRLVTAKRRQLLTDRKRLAEETKNFTTFSLLKTRRARLTELLFMKRLDVLKLHLVSLESELGSAASLAGAPSEEAQSGLEATRQNRASLEMRKLKTERERDRVRANLEVVKSKLIDSRTLNKYMEIKKSRLYLKQQQLQVILSDLGSKVVAVSQQETALSEFVRREQMRHKSNTVEHQLSVEHRQALNGLRTEVACMTSDLVNKKKTAEQQVLRQRREEERVAGQEAEVTKERDRVKARIDVEFGRVREQEEAVNAVELRKNELKTKVGRREEEIAHMRRREVFVKDERARISAVLGEVKDHEVSSKKQEELKIFVNDLKRQLSTGMGENKVLGVLRALIKPTQKRFEQVLTVGLRKFLDAVVVVDTETAVSVVRRAKERRKFAVSVVALDNFFGGSSSGSSSVLPAGCRYLRDCVTGTSGAVLTLVRAMAGDTLVAETLEIARDAAFSKGFKKVITVEGTKLSRSGIVDVQEASTIGNLGFGSLAESRTKLETVDKELASLAQMIDMAKDEIADSGEELRKLELDTLSAKASFHVARQEYERRLQNLNGLEGELAKLGRELQTLKSAGSVVELEVRIAAIDAERKTRVEGLCQEFLTLVGLQGVFDWRAVAERPDNSEFDRKMSKISDQISALQLEAKKLDSSRESQAAALAEVEAEMQKLDATATTGGEELEAEFAKLEAETALAQSAFEAAVSEREAIERKFREDSETLAKLRRLQEERASRVAALNTEISSLNFRAQEVLSKAELEGVILLEEASDWRSLDFSEVRRQTPERLQQELAEVTAELEATAAVHAPATEAVAEAEQRVMVEWEEAKKEFATLSKKLEEVKTERKRKFDECTAFVAARLAEYYDVMCGERRDLPGDRSEVFGYRVEGTLVAWGEAGQSVGRAFLDVEIPEEPWRGGLSFRAMPPGKRLTEIASLSGGERTMASAALLFALAAWSGTKFVVVDELDAALDKHNVARLVNFIKHLNLQVIAISLKEDVYARADALIGVWRAERTSNIACLDLSPYDEDEADVRASVRV